MDDHTPFCRKKPVVHADITDLLPDVPRVLLASAKKKQEPKGHPARASNGSRPALCVPFALQADTL